MAPHQDAIVEDDSKGVRPREEDGDSKDDVNIDIEADADVDDMEGEEEVDHETIDRIYRYLHPPNSPVKLRN